MGEILATSEELTTIINRAVKRIGENHALARDNKGITLKNKDFKTEDSTVIEEALKVASEEMAEKMVLEQNIDSIVKEQVKAMGGGSGFLGNQGTSNTLDKFNKRQEMGEQEAKDIEEPKVEEKTVNENTTDIIKKLVRKKLNEAKKTSIPGYEEFEKVYKDTTKETKAYHKDFKKKFEEYADFEGNSKPKFPHQESSKTDTHSPMYRNDAKEEEFIEDWRGMGLEDADGIGDMGKLVDYLEGSSTTGNAQVDEDGNALGNVVPNDVGERIEKKVKRKKEKIETQEKEMSNDRRYSPDVQKVKQVKEDVSVDIESMKKLWSYSKNTQ